MFALLVACLTLFLKRNAAHLRFNLWLVASVKFLLPFAVFVRIGDMLGARIAPAARADFVTILELAGQPFGPTTAHLVHSTWRERLPAAIPALLGALWITGTAAVFVISWWRWLEASRVRRDATQLSRGPEAELMRSLVPGVGAPPLVLRQETKPGPVFALVVGEGGAKFATITPPDAPGTKEPLLSMRVMEKDGQGQITLTGRPGGLADSLSAQVGRPIVDKTGLNGTYNIHFHWDSTSAIPADLQQQLGLALVPQTWPVQTSVIESVTAPAGS